MRKKWHLCALHAQRCANKKACFKRKQGVSTTWASPPKEVGKIEENGKRANVLFARLPFFLFVVNGVFVAVKVCTHPKVWFGNDFGAQPLCFAVFFARSVLFGNGFSKTDGLPVCIRGYCGNLLCK